MISAGCSRDIVVEREHFRFYFPTSVLRLRIGPVVPSAVDLTTYASHEHTDAYAYDIEHR